MLVATDVAARGLDVKDIAYVINYDFPVDGVEVGFDMRIYRRRCISIDYGSAAAFPFDWCITAVV